MFFLPTALILNGFPKLWIKIFYSIIGTKHSFFSVKLIVKLVGELARPDSARFYRTQRLDPIHLLVLSIKEFYRPD